MISFSLLCENEHQFDGWFASSDDFELQRKRNLVNCPVCDSCKVEKSLMAPQVSTGRAKEEANLAAADSVQREVLDEMKKMRAKFLDNAEDVGKDFPEEARKIHYGESEKKHVYGEATPDDVASLTEEGVAIAPIPVLPDDVN